MLTCNHPSILGKLISGARKIIACQLRKTRKNTYWEPHNEASNKDKKKAKFYNFSFTNQPQTQALKKDKRGCWRGYPTIAINATKVAKKDKDKAKDLSHVECYTCK